MNHADADPAGPPRAAPAAPARGAAAGGFRPTLFGEEDPPLPAGADGLRILGSLQPPPRPRPRRIRWLAVTAGACVAAALGVLAWLALRQTAPLPQARPPLPAASAVPQPPDAAASADAARLRGTLGRRLHGKAAQGARLSAA